MMVESVTQELVGSYELVSTYFSRVDSIADIVNARSTDPNLRTRGYWTGNFAVYGSENRNGTWQPFILLGDDSTLNPVQNDALAAVIQFKHQEEYKPSSQELDAILDAEKEGKVVRIDYHQLDHFGGLRTKMRIIDGKKDEENCHLIVDAERLANFQDENYFNPEQRKLLKAIYGNPELMGKMMIEEGIQKTAIGLVNEFYLEQLGRGKMIARTSWTNRKSYNYEVSHTAKYGDEVRMRGQLK